MTLAEFLFARIADDEQVARSRARDDSLGQAGALASCIAKRRIVADFGGPDSGGVDEWTAEAVLKALALSYSDHPDFDPIWRGRRTPLE